MPEPPDSSLPSRALKGVIFDLDGTLYDHRRLRVAVAMALVRNLGFRPARLLRVARILQCYRSALVELRSRAERCEHLRDVQVALTASRCGESVDAVRECVRRWFTELPLPLLKRAAQPGLADALQWMRRANLKLAVLSDYPAAAKLEAMGIQQHFDLVLCADEVGFLKPHPAGLHAVLEQLELRKDEVLYVGDRFEIDGLAARRAGVSCAIVGRRGSGSGDWVICASFPELLRLVAARARLPE